MFIVIDFKGYTSNKKKPIPQRFDNITDLMLWLNHCKINVGLYGGVNNLMVLIKQVYQTNTGKPLKLYEKEGYRVIFVDTDINIVVCYDIKERRESIINDIIIQS